MGIALMLPFILEKEKKDCANPLILPDFIQHILYLGIMVDS